MKALNAAIQILESQTEVTRSEVTRIEVSPTEVTPSAAIHDAAPNAVSLSSASPIAATRFWVRVVIRVALFSVQNAAQYAVSLPGPLVPDAPHEVSRVAAP